MFRIVFHLEAHCTKLNLVVMSPLPVAGDPCRQPSWHGRLGNISTAPTAPADAPSPWPLFLHGVSDLFLRWPLPHLPLWGWGRRSAHLTVCVRWQLEVCAPALSSTVDQERRHQVVRALQVRLPDDHQDQTLQKGECVMTSDPHLWPSPCDPLSHSGRSWRWRRWSGGRLCAQWRSISLPSRASFGRCMCSSTARPRRSVTASWSGPSGPSWLWWPLASRGGWSSCTSSARCTCSYASGGARTIASSSSRTAPRADTSCPFRHTRLPRLRGNKCARTRPSPSFSRRPFRTWIQALPWLRVLPAFGEEEKEKAKRRFHCLSVHQSCPFACTGASPVTIRRFCLLTLRDHSHPVAPSPSPWVSWAPHCGTPHFHIPRISSCNIYCIDFLFTSEFSDFSDNFMYRSCFDIFAVQPCWPTGITWAILCSWMLISRLNCCRCVSVYANLANAMKENGLVFDRFSVGMHSKQNLHNILNVQEKNLPNSISEFLFLSVEGFSRDGIECRLADGFPKIINANSAFITYLTLNYRKIFFGYASYSWKVLNIVNEVVPRPSAGGWHKVQKWLLNPPLHTVGSWLNFEGTLFSKSPGFSSSQILNICASLVQWKRSMYQVSLN